MVQCPLTPYSTFNGLSSASEKSVHVSYEGVLLNAAQVQVRKGQGSRSRARRVSDSDCLLSPTRRLLRSQTLLRQSPHGPLVRPPKLHGLLRLYPNLVPRPLSLQVPLPKPPLHNPPRSLFHQLKPPKPLQRCSHLRLLPLSPQLHPSLPNPPNLTSPRRALCRMLQRFRRPQRRFV